MREREYTTKTIIMEFTFNYKKCPPYLSTVTYCLSRDQPAILGPPYDGHTLFDLFDEL